MTCYSCIATSELRKMPGKSEVDNASWDCFRGRKRKARPQKQSRDALSTSLLPGLLRNSEVADMYRTPEFLARAATTSWSLLQLDCSSLMTSSKHFETTGGHIGPAYLAGLRLNEKVLS